MSIIGAFTVPHPPLIVPTVGKGSELAVSATTRAFETVASRIASLCPETIVVTTPHSILYSDYFHLSPGCHARGSFASFRAPQTVLEADYDSELVSEICRRASEVGLSAGTDGERDASLDHATMVPLYFVNQCYTDYQLVRVGLSGLPLYEHYRLGELIAAASEELSRRVVFIASGDLSHRLKEDGPYGFNASGPVYDKRVMEVLSRGDFGELFDFSESLCDEAAECGHRSFVIMAGALDRRRVICEQLSYEGPMGVGYGVCSFEPGDVDESRAFGKQYLMERDAVLQERKTHEGAYVRLARHALELYVREGRVATVPDYLPPEMTSRQAGVFVSLKSHGQLRGCIGTIGPTTGSIAEEIIQNAISAGTRDPRFPSVDSEELGELVYSVDVLSESELISSEDELDVKRYGVIVSKGGRRGLLLPNLDGVDTVAKQVSIAKQKAGLPADAPGVTLERFEVVRHH